MQLAFKVLLSGLISLVLTNALFGQDRVVAQESLPVPSDSAQTFKLSDLDPEVASRIKSQHYAAQDQNLKQAYHQQLQENRQRSAFSAQRAVFEHAVSGGLTSGQFSPAAHPATLTQASHHAPFPRTSANPAPTNAADDAAPKTYMPPVHIPPMRTPYKTGVPASTINGHRDAVQNFAQQTSSSQTVPNRSYSKPIRRQPTAHGQSLARRQRQLQRTKPAPVTKSASVPKSASVSNQAVEVKSTHVFLQDRIANALARHFKRGQQPTENTPAERSVKQELSTENSSSKEAPAKQLAASASVAAEAESVMEPQTVSPPVYQQVSTATEEQPVAMATDDYQPEPLVDETIVASEPFVDDQSFSEILESNRYASRVQTSKAVSRDVPADHRIDAKLKARQRSIERAVHHDHHATDRFELSIADENTTILDRYEKIRQTSGERDELPALQTLRPAVKRSPRIAAYSRPVQYGLPAEEVPADNVSILLQEEVDDSPFADADDFKPDDDIDMGAARDDFNLDSDLRQGSGTKNRPNLRDDLRDAEESFRRDDRLDGDRVRSRLDDDLDLEEIDREIDEQLENDAFENDRPSRAPRKTCIQFQDELIAGSIRDISLDISPPAANEGAQYGGIARTWTDRRGNILATGALVDLRRGYVILDTGEKLAYARLSEADLAAVSEFWRLPEVCVIGNRGGSPYRNWTPQVVTWKASNLCHKPLYFENIQLERYGHSRGPVAQPIHSTLHFFTRLVALPYMTGICPPNECEYALGYYRPGNCAPWLKEPVPISLEGIRREALFVTGAAFIP